MKSAPTSKAGSNNQERTFTWGEERPSLPSSPGVYWFCNQDGKVIYIGKAKNLQKRVATYRRQRQLRPRIKQMVQQAVSLSFKPLASELQALLIEAELIRLHQPEFNVLLKDDKSPIYVHIPSGPFPPVKTVRRRDIYQHQLQGTILGPFASAYQLKQVLRLARKIFPWCDEAYSRLDKKTKAQQTLAQYQQACFYHHLELCPGACVGQISPDEYQQNLEQLVLFLRGQKQDVATRLEQEMKQAADQLQFEQAAQLRDKIAMIDKVTQPKFRLKPDLILPAVHDNQVQTGLNHLRKILNDFVKLPRQYRLKRIEGYDVSNIQGQAAAVSLVAFTQGLPDKKNYRLFNIKSIDTPNDYQMLKEAISRRQNHPEWGKPNLVVVDGGKGQIRATLQVWQWASPVIGIAKPRSQARGQTGGQTGRMQDGGQQRQRHGEQHSKVAPVDRIIIPTRHYRDKNTHRLKIEYEVLKLKPDHPSLKLVQHIRDEAHRFAKKQHARLRRRALVG
jgi:excinuclease ABC subunit C